MDDKATYRLVQQRYGAHADGMPQSDRAHDEKVAIAFGYSLEDIQSIPQDANMGVSCGNPLATANLRQGEVVVDLGSGGGLDVILAAKKVGPNGASIGVDMTKSMLELGRRNVERAGLTNATFVESSIVTIPLSSSTVDCVISNCVVNLVPDSDKPKVFQEIFRLLKPGGRLAISDILARAELPPHIRQDAALFVECIAGASLVEEYERYMQEAGFEGSGTAVAGRDLTSGPPTDKHISGILIIDTKSDLNVYESGQTAGCCGSKSRTDETNAAPELNGVHSAASESAKVDLNEWVGSFRIFATKSANV
ncbi:MAG: hypothetical protein M4579_000020 [Chaenotheca gracillima]|nr:MAG: hypothetical protein M4579_000020 [Chaenotheca gracillima]